MAARKKTTKRKSSRRQGGVCGCPTGMQLAAYHPSSGKKLRKPTCASATKSGKVKLRAMRCLPPGYRAVNKPVKTIRRTVRVG